jgi:uncharacterized membrane protein HdeD (DUF308 family)
VTADPLPAWVTIAFGVLTTLIGVVLLAWPRATLFVAIVLFAAQLIVFGAIQLIRCVSPWAADAGERARLAASGILALLTALLILRRPLQSVVVVTLLIGVWWLVHGIVDIVGAVPAGGAHRGWSLFLGALSLIAGVYVLLNPGISLMVFIRVSGLWMIASGIAVAVAAFTLRPGPDGAARTGVTRDSGRPDLR